MKFLFILPILVSVAIESRAESVDSMDRVINCNGKITNLEEVKDIGFDPQFKENIVLEINQLRDNSEFNWKILLRSSDDKVQMESHTNGPLSKDGTTFSPADPERSIYLQGLSHPIFLEEASGNLVGSFSYLQKEIDKEYKLPTYFYVDYALQCEKTKIDINDSEYMIYEAKHELEVMTMHNSLEWLIGVGVTVSETLQAIGVNAYHESAEKQAEFVKEFKQRGLVQEAGGDYFFIDSKKNQLKLNMEITGPISPPTPHAAQTPFSYKKRNSH